MNIEEKDMLADVLNSITQDELIDVFYRIKIESREALSEMLSGPLSNEVITREALSLSVEGMQKLMSKLQQRMESQEKLRGTLKLTKKQHEPELKTLGAVDMNTYKAALDLVQKYKRGEQSARRLNINKSFRQIDVSNKFRLISTDEGKTWTVMGAAQYAKQLKIWNKAA